MRALCIVGSPRSDGSTARLVASIAEGMASRGIEVRTRALGDLHIGYCLGCRSCEQTRQCCQRDDMDLLTAEMLEADVLVLASPSYWGGVTGQMKVFFDRSTPLCSAKTGRTIVPPGKLGIGVAVRAGQSAAENRHLIDAFRHYLGHLGIEMLGSLTVEGVDNLADLETKPEALGAAYELGRRCAGAPWTR